MATLEEQRKQGNAEDAEDAVAVSCDDGECKSGPHGSRRCLIYLPVHRCDAPAIDERCARSHSIVSNRSLAWHDTIVFQLPPSVDEHEKIAPRATCSVDSACQACSLHGQWTSRMRGWCGKSFAWQRVRMARMAVLTESPPLRSGREFATGPHRASEAGLGGCVRYPLLFTAHVTFVLASFIRPGHHQGEYAIEAVSCSRVLICRADIVCRLSTRHPGRPPFPLAAFRIRITTCLQ